MNIRLVQTKADPDRFIRLPYRFYRDDPVWVPPLRSEQRSQFNPQRNPMLHHCEYALFLLEEDHRVLGRIAAFVDTLAVDFWEEPIGLFWYYECVPDHIASRVLLQTAADWLRRRVMRAMRGPWTFVSQEWGLVVDGFTPRPVIVAPYNPPYCDDHMTAFGLARIKDLLYYYVSVHEGYRILTLTDAVARQYGVSVRQSDMRRHEQEVQTFLDLSNHSLVDNWGYSPVTPAEAEAMSCDLRQIIQPQGVVFAEDARGHPIGFAMALPDVNTLPKGLNGRPLPFGWLKLLLGLPWLRSYRMFALGVIPKCHGRAIDSLIYRALYKSLYTPDLWMEINYVLEDNVPMSNAIKKLNAKPQRRYGVYQRGIWTLAAGQSRCIARPSVHRTSPHTPVATPPVASAPHEESNLCYRICPFLICAQAQRVYNEICTRSPHRNDRRVTPFHRGQKARSPRPETFVARHPTRDSSPWETERFKEANGPQIPQAHSSPGTECACLV